MNVVSERHQGQMSAFPQLRWDEGSANNIVLCEPTQQVTGNTMECTFLVDIYKGTLKGSSLSGRDPVLPTKHCSSETSLGASTLTTGEHTTCQ